jgi:hypothetical protein
VTDQDADLEAAWDAVHEALPAHWRVGLPSFDPAGDGLWSVTAVDERSVGRGKAPQSVTGTGEDETAALRDLDDRLRGIAKPDGTRLEELRRRLRFAYLEGAEEWSREHAGRGLTVDELESVIARAFGLVE